MVGQIREFEGSAGLRLQALSAKCPPVVASEVVVGEGLFDRAPGLASPCSLVAHCFWPGRRTAATAYGETAEFDLPAGMPHVVSRERCGRGQREGSGGRHGGC